MAVSASVLFGVVGAIFASLAVCVSMFLIVSHLRFYTQPNHQRYIIRILVMVPAYAIYSVLSLFFWKYHVYFALARDSYEAYVMYQFFVLCLNYGGGFENLAQRIASGNRFGLAFPFTCIKVQPGRGFLKACRRGVLQYVIIKPLCSFVAAMLQIKDLYQDGEINVNRGYMYIALTTNTSVTIALYFLIFFYQASHEELKPYRPLLKFICIKFVIFFSFWQGVAIVILVSVGLIPSSEEWSSGQFAMALQNLLICIEMLIVALLHMKAFPYDVYRVKFMTQAPLIHPVEMGSWLKSVKDSANQKDVLSDTYDSFVPGVLKKGSTNKGSLLEDAEPEPISTPTLSKESSHDNSSQHHLDASNPNQHLENRLEADDQGSLSNIRR